MVGQNEHPRDEPPASAASGSECDRSEQVETACNAPVAQVKHAGRISYFYECWLNITSNPVILDWVRNGFPIPFACEVVQTHIPQVHLSPSERADMTVAIEKLMSLGTVTSCKPCNNQFISKTFLTVKPNGEHRFILNLKILNNFISKLHFKMEDYRTASRLVPANGFMATIDLKEAYFLISIRKSDRKFLRFQFENENREILTYEFSALPYGLSVAPRTFTKIMKEVISHLRRQGFKNVFYLDDILCIGDSYDECQTNVKATIKLLECLGFIINYGKSSLTPKQSCKFLGFMFNSINQTISLPSEKCHKINKLVQKFTNTRKCTIRNFAQLIGVLVAACPAAKYGWLYTKILERQKYLALQNNPNFEATFKPHPIILNDLNWWKLNVFKISNSMKTASYDLEIYTDASRTGWGAVCNTERARGAWKINELESHINYLELLAVFLALKYFASEKHDCSILLRVDNTTAISYVNRMGGIQFPHLNDLSRQIWQWSEERNIWLFASYINTKENTEADEESRKHNPDTECELSASAFDEITKCFGEPEIDLFASRANAKCQNFMSWKRDPDASAIDAFTVKWNTSFFYAFPPFPLILKCLQKIVEENATGILIFPFWPSQAWYPQLMKFVVSNIIWLNPKDHRIKSCYRNPLILGAAVLSGRRSHHAASPNQPWT